MSKPLSALPASSTPAWTDTIIGVQSGPTDVQETRLANRIFAGSVNVSSAATVNLATVAAKYFNLTGAATVTSWGTKINSEFWVRSLGTALIKNNGGCVCPFAQDLQLASGDMFRIQTDGSGVVTIGPLQRASAANARSDIGVGSNYLSQPFQPLAFGSADFIHGQATTITPPTTRTGQTANRHELAVLNFADYFDPSSEADCTATLMTFLLYCQMVALEMKDAGLDDQSLNCYVTAWLPRGDYVVSSPVVVPGLVNLKCDGLIIRKPNFLTGGTDTFTGDPASQALNNVYQPVVIIVPNSHSEKLNFYCNPDGNPAHQGNGMVTGKNWTASAVTLQAIGTGYHVGDVITGATPDLAPYGGFTYHVDTINGSGGILTGHMVYAGAYSLPSYQQGVQWTTQNGFLDAITNNPVFTANNSGVFFAYGGNGTGATFTVTWASDYSGVNYYGGQALVGDGTLGTIRGLAIPFLYDAVTHGPTFGVMWWGLNHTFENIAIGGGHFGGLMLNCDDIHGNHFNPVNSDFGLQIYSGGSIKVTNVVLDTCEAGFLVIDQADSIDIDGIAFGVASNPRGGPSGSGYAVLIGAASSGVQNCNLNIRLNMSLTGKASAGGTPAAYLSYTRDSRINLICGNGNRSSANPGINPTTYFADIGPGWEASNLIEGSLDQVAGAFFKSATAPNTPGGSNSPPAGGVRVWDQSANGYAGVAGTYQMWGNGAPTNGVTGANKAGKGSTYMDYSTANLYRNTGTPGATTWVNP